MPDCLFCKIVSRQIPSDKVYEDDLVYAFKDINPVAPVHILVIPKDHISSILDVDCDNSMVIARIYEVIAKLAKDFNLEKGFRVVSNCNEHGGQTVFHLHFHLIGGRQLSLDMA